MIKGDGIHDAAGDYVVLYPGDYLNGIEGEKLEDMCVSFLKKGFKRIIIDFSETELVNSIGVSILIGVIEKTREHGGTLSFARLTGVNRRIFDIMGLTGHVRIFETLEEAAGAGDGLRAHQ